MRLDKYISNQTPLSRSEAVKAIRSGRVLVDGSCVREAKTQVNESSNAISLDGKEVSFKKNIYLMLNKPVDFISSTEDRNHKQFSSFFLKSIHAATLSPVEDWISIQRAWFF
ncbi:MAG: S4 domain-containing protein [Lentisphaeraceae bacterium]|nr:S4 domain-containing protein [Lentisphaeraceae bacterium]